MMIKRMVVLIYLPLFLLPSNSLWAYNGKVHSKLNEEATLRNSNLDSFLKTQVGIASGIDSELVKNGKTKRIYQWLAYGGEAEDFGKGGENDFLRTRAYNHFHDPLKPWNEAGFDHWLLNDVCRDHYGRDPISPILWGLESGEQDFPENTTGDWSWGKAREYYYTYLTGKDFIGNTVAVTKGEREAAFADCFRAVGQVMHLLEDTSVPLHTRNDLHIFPITKIPFKNEDLPVPIGRWTYETYTAKNIGFLDYIPDQSGDRPPASLLDYPNPDPGNNNIVPVSGLFDRNQYTLNSGLLPSTWAMGLAEYSNAYFFTQDTIWRHYPHPAKEDTTYADIDWLRDAEVVDAEDGQPDNCIYIKFKEGVGTDINHLAAIRYFKAELDRLGEPDWFYLDATCWKDYADKLIPRAVGYSAALLDYFFRGTMDIQAAMPQTDHRCWISGINFEVKNTTLLAGGLDIELFENGNLSLSYQYTPPGQTEPQYGLVEGNLYPTITNSGDPINSGYVSISASFDANNYIPAGSTDISFTIVFKGKLGHEENSVVGKVFSMNASRIAYSYRPGGWPNPSHIYTILPDGTDKRQITNDALGESAFFSPSWGPDATMLAFENETGACPGSNCIAYPREIDVIDMTSELSYPDNVIRRLNIYDTRIDDEGNPYSIVALFHPSFSPDGSQIVAWAQGQNVNYIYPLVIFDVDTGEWQYINGYEYWEQKSAPGENKSSVAWSPQGDKIAYAAIEDHGTFSDMDIYTINPDGTEDVRILDDDFTSGDPSWSQDGEQIVFVSDRDGEDEYYDIWIMDKDGQNPSKIYSCIPHCAGPSFSPDGSRIVFRYGETVHSVGVDGTGLELIETEASSPLWSPFLCSP